MPNVRNNTCFSSIIYNRVRFRLNPLCLMRQRDVASGAPILKSVYMEGRHNGALKHFCYIRRGNPCGCPNTFLQRRNLIRGNRSFVNRKRMIRVVGQASRLRGLGAASRCLTWASPVTTTQLNSQTNLPLTFLPIFAMIVSIMTQYVKSAYNAVLSCAS